MKLNRMKHKEGGRCKSLTKIRGTHNQGMERNKRDTTDTGEGESLW